MKRMKIDYEKNEIYEAPKTFRFFRYFRLFRNLALVLILGFFTIIPQHAKSIVEERQAQIDAALFTRAEFFGSQAIIPYPTAEGRERLAELQKQYPQDSGISLKLAELDEKLGKAEQAHLEMLRYVELEKNSPESLQKLVFFYDRLARFADEAVALEQIIKLTPRDQHALALDRLITLADRHHLEKFRNPEFFNSLIAADPGDFEVVVQSLVHLLKRKDYSEALKAVRRYKLLFPDKQDYFLEKEVDALLGLKKDKEAEAIYIKSFDPFWAEHQSYYFYEEFLSRRDRLRAYGRELKQASHRNPADFDVAVRLFHYSRYNYMDEDGAGRVFSRLEKARSDKGIKWSADELATAAQLLIADNQIDLASRFLYTLYQTGNLHPGSDLRAKILYRLFKTTANAGENRTPMSAGDLKFYQDVARSDPHPGMLGGVLSLVLADSNPQFEYQREEEIAVAHFNRSAAYRLFNEYRKEYPTSPELAQMYQDLIGICTDGGETEIAAGLLAEFEKRHLDAPFYPEVALNLAETYMNRRDYQREREVYQKILDYLGSRRIPGIPLVQSSAARGMEELNSKIPSQNTDQSSSGNTEFRPVALAQPAERVTYAGVLERYVTSLARENRTAEVIELYANEIKKYGDEQGLYEQMLYWLSQTNLVEDQLRVYQEASKRFQSNIWTDRLARWYLRRERKAEFERFSNELLRSFDEREIEDYLGKFVQSGSSYQAPNFDRKLYLALYLLAHERFPQNMNFVNGLARYYSGHGQWDQWRRLMAEYYFKSPEIRRQYLVHLANQNRIREYANLAREKTAGSPVYQLFQADAAAWLSNYEEAIEAYRDLNRLYPNTPEFAGRLVAFTRSLGQKEQKFLEEAATVQQAISDALPVSEIYRTTAGEVYAELGDFKRAAREWERLLSLGVNDNETYLNTATLYWDYFQYGDALRVINSLRKRKNDRTLYAFQAGAILEMQQEKADALEEYIRALDEDSPDYYRALRRLKTLYHGEGMGERLRQAFQSELGRAKNRESLVLGYTDLLSEAEQWPQASSLLRNEIERSRSPRFLKRARDYFSDNKDTQGEEAALRRLIETARNERFEISYRMQSAEYAVGKGRREAAFEMIDRLVDRFPTNFGVLSESADFLWRSGARQQAVLLLARAGSRSRGKFSYIFARKLADRQFELGRMADAERVLTQLHDKNPLDIDVFNKLSQIYLRTSRPQALRDRYRATIRALNKSDLERLELRERIAELRGRVIVYLTQLKDYDFAIDQHIEIINRDPDDEEKFHAAIRYARRYGGVERLIGYYQAASQQAYKDYRWNLVLARLYGIKNDWEGARRELDKAIVNQPEMIELQSELAETCLNSGDYPGAVAALGRARELSNDDPKYLRRLAEVLDKWGRKSEAEAIRALLPVENPHRGTITERFAAAESMRRSEMAKAIETYRKAFDDFAGDFYKHELRGNELSAYLETMRGAESLDLILRRVWDVRERIKADSVKENHVLAGKARSLLALFDTTLPEAVGRIASEYATGDELAALERDVRQWMIMAKGRPDEDETLVILLNLSRRSGLGALTEQILIARKDSAYSLHYANYQSHVISLVNFYAEHGDYSRVIGLLKQEAARDRSPNRLNYQTMIAEYARVSGDLEKELQALRLEYQSGNPNLVDRYFEALLENGEAGRNELKQCIRQATIFRYRLIGFLVSNNEMQMAREAIHAAPHPSSWKSSRLAELSLITKDLNPDNEANFLSALNWKPIGELIKGKPDASQQLIGDNWFYLAEGYGRWLALSEQAQQIRSIASSVFLPAMLENRPKDAGEQERLATWYQGQGQGQAENALEHFTLASEMNPDRRQIIAGTGSALFKLGREREAREQWNRIIESPAAGKSGKVKPPIDDCLLYLRTLVGHGLAAEARAKLRPLVIERLNEIDREDNYENSGNGMEQLTPLIRSLVASFNDKLQESENSAISSEKARFLQGLCDATPKNTALPELVIRNTLVTRNHLAPFYEILINRTEALARYELDADFVELLRDHPDWTLEELEAYLDQGDRKEAGEVSGERLDLQKEYILYLLDQRRMNVASKVAAEIEQEIKGRFPRPAWLRLAKIRAEVQAGRVSDGERGLIYFVGIAVSPHIDKVAAPRTERLNLAVEMLVSEGHRKEADDLLIAAYERMIALEQLTTGSLASLSRLAFSRGETQRGEKILRLMVALGRADTRDSAAAELAVLPWVKARSISPENSRWITVPEPVNYIAEADALLLAAETAGDFEQIAMAIDYRRQLLILAPQDHLNRLELARLFAAKQQANDALNLLSELMTDRMVPRRLRWTALWNAPEIVNGRADLWGSIAARVRATGSQDREMIAALDAISLSERKQENDAIKISNDAANVIPAPQLKIFTALLEKRGGRERESLQRLLDSMIDLSDSSIAAPFNATEDGLRWQIIRLYAAQGRLRAALKVASSDERLKGQNPVQMPVDNLRQKTLAARAAGRERKSRSEIFGLLSIAAEQINEFNKAADFERARLSFLANDPERRKAEARIEELMAKHRGIKKPVVFVVDERPVTTR